MNDEPMRIDAHQHFWNYNQTDYAWMSEAQASIKRDFLPEHLQPLLAAIGFDGSIAVQARVVEIETDHLLNLAKQYDLIKGVVGWVDLQAPDVAERLARYAQDPKLKGVRHPIHDEPDVDFMLRSDFQRGIAELPQFGLTYDLLLRPQHLPNAIKLVEKFPDQPFVIDHIAKPLIKEQVFSLWQEDIRELARFDNVCCKVSGMVTEADWQNWKPEDMHPYLDIVFDAFGEDRIMIGSDWPVCTVAGDYVTVMRVVIDYLQAFSERARAQILGGNCARFYRVNDTV